MSESIQDWSRLQKMIIHWMALVRRMDAFVLSTRPERTGSSLSAVGSDVVVAHLMLTGRKLIKRSSALSAKLRRASSVRQPVNLSVTSHPPAATVAEALHGLVGSSAIDWQHIPSTKWYKTMSSSANEPTHQL